jgi:translation initiation factor 2B subunit (eIF-2B alpha/beta/delta family)
MSDHQNLSEIDYSQEARNRNYVLTQEKIQALIDNLKKQEPTPSSLNILTRYLMRMKFGLDSNGEDLNSIKEVLYENLNKISNENIGHDWDKTHTHNSQLNVDQLFEWLKRLQLGRQIKKTRDCML